MSNYPPGVTGNEYAIAGPDYEQDRIVPCRICQKYTEALVQGYHGERWYFCYEHETSDGESITLDPEDGTYPIGQAIHGEPI